ncbi:hypothetical protein C8F01DRAFT_1112716 [Mycena amicta]|nr:hypothetical protein C8F01DRAFT_1112716 [Mycena amicta]
MSLTDSPFKQRLRQLFFAVGRRRCLREIFVRLDLPGTEHNAVLHPLQPPLVFGRVCRYWRQTSHATPRLWNTLHVVGLRGYNGDASPEVSSAASKTLGNWLNRTGSCLLSVSFIERFRWRPPRDADDDDDAPDEGNPLLGDPHLDHFHHLFQLLKRIQHLDICSESRLFRALFQGDPSETPALESFRFVDVSATSQLPQNSTILRSPKLKTVALVIGADALALPLLWEQLVSLTLSCSSVWTLPPGGNGNWTSHGGLDQNGFFQILERCPNLVHCELEITNPSILEAFSTPITHLQLQDLRLTSSLGPNGVQPQLLLQRLVIPNLRFLFVGESLRSQTMHYQRPGAHLLDDDSEMDGGGLTVHISPSLIVEDVILDILQLYPETTTLQLASYRGAPRSWPPHDESLNREFFQRLAGEGLGLANTACAPKIRQLHIEFATPAIAHTGFVEFLQRRRREGVHSSLKRVSVHFASIGDRRADVIGSRSRVVDVGEELKALEDAGLEVKLEYREPLAQPEWRYLAMGGLEPERMNSPVPTPW